MTRADDVVLRIDEGGSDFGDVGESSRATNATNIEIEFAPQRIDGGLIIRDELFEAASERLDAFGRGVDFRGGVFRGVRVEGRGVGGLFAVRVGVFIGFQPFENRVDYDDFRLRVARTAKTSFGSKTVLQKPVVTEAFFKLGLIELPVVESGVGARTAPKEGGENRARG